MQTKILMKTDYEGIETFFSKFGKLTEKQLNWKSITSPVKLSGEKINNMDILEYSESQILEILKVDKILKANQKAEEKAYHESPEYLAEKKKRREDAIAYANHERWEEDDF